MRPGGATKWASIGPACKLAMSSVVDSTQIKKMKVDDESAENQMKKKKKDRKKKDK